MNRSTSDRPLALRFIAATGGTRTLAGLSAVVALFLVMSGCPRGSSTGELSSADLAAIRNASLAYPEAWLTNQPEKVKATLTSDAVLMPSGGMAPIEGMAAISEFFWPPETPPFDVTEYVMQPEEVAGHASLAFVRGTMSLTFDTESDQARETYTTAGTYLMILRPISDGSWRISRYTWNHPPWELVASEPLDR